MPMLACETEEVEKAVNADSKKLDAVIVGLGQTGMSCARYLASRGRSFAVIDSRFRPPLLEDFRKEFPGTEISLGRFDDDLLARGQQVLVSPGVSTREPELQAVLSNAELVGDIELFAREVQIPVVSITGSNGKSTVTSLLADMCECAQIPVAVGGNIGTPALSLLDDHSASCCVLELSSFQLETTESLQSLAAVVLNISADHLDRYENLDDYAAAKARIYRNAEVAVVNLDDARVCRMPVGDARTVTFSIRAEAAADVSLMDIDGKTKLCLAGDSVIPVDEIALRGQHNLANALAAVALASALDIPSAAMASSLSRFTGLAHRSQLIASRAGVDFINDSKATNVGAACAALSGLDEYERIVLIAGGVGKGGQYEPLAKAACGRVRAAVLIGEEARAIADVFQPFVPAEIASSMDSAVVRAAQLAQPGDAVLLAPACASFDMFDNFQARGDAFVHCVQGLVE